MDLQQLKLELNEELEQILQYWALHSPDLAQKGFYGRIDNDNKPDPDAPKGAVLNARILWTFSNASHPGKHEYLAIAHRAFEYIYEYFHDKQYGGIYWSVDSKGNPLDTKNQVYALAFVIYACCEYCMAYQSKPALDLAIQLYNLIQQHSFDPKRGGYFEAFTREWRPLDDLRLSARDANEKKTMNTHLHVLEAYATLYHIWPKKELQKSILLLLKNFDEHIINRKTGHLKLFFDEDWNPKSDTVSYGHDIEAAWLLWEAADLTGDEKLLERMTENAMLLANAAKEGLDVDGGLWYEYEPQHKKLVKEKHWWPQAEAMVGFFHAWQLSGEDEYRDIVFANWNFIRQYIKDKRKGEWFWGVDENYHIMQGQDKAGFWKCPYHNSRACMEVIKRIGRMC